jgi:hypothetical protein
MGQSNSAAQSLAPKCAELMIASDPEEAVAIKIVQCRIVSPELWTPLRFLAEKAGSSMVNNN